MKYSPAILLSIIVLINQVNTLNILAIFPYHGKSHFFVFKVYLRELANRGHNVTVISHFPEEDAQANYHDISLAGSMKAVEDNTPVERSYKTILSICLFLTYTGRDNCKMMLANKQVRNLIENKAKFDVIVVEQFNSDCALGIAYKLGAPVVGITSHILMPYHYKRYGIPNNPAFVPFHFLEGGTKPSLYQKVERVLFDVYFRTFYYLISQRSDQNTLAEYYDDVPPLEDLGREIKLLLLYHNFILTGSRLFPSNVIEVGGYHVSTAKPLTGELKKFIDESENGVVYVSFGSVVKCSTMPEDKLQAILGAMNELPQRFIWKWENKSMIFDKNKLYISDWLPQVDILGHPKTLAFLSHAGMGGTTEAIHYGVPMVAVPIIGDQPANAASVEESGLGVQLQIQDMTQENLLAAFKKVLDPKFRANAKLVSQAWHDRPMSPLDTAIYWTEFAAKYPNFTFRTPAADVPLYQHLNLDIAAVFAAFFAVLFAMYKVLRYICCKSGDKPLTGKKKAKRQ